MPWLVRDGDVLASAELAATRRSRRRGLLGRDCVEVPLVLRPCRAVHTIGMRMPIDVVWCAADGHVLRTASVPPRRVTRLVPTARFVIEAEVGWVERWGLAPGQIVQVVETDR